MRFDGSRATCMEVQGNLLLIRIKRHARNGTLLIQGDNFSISNAVKHACYSFHECFYFQYSKALLYEVNQFGKECFSANFAAYFRKKDMPLSATRTEKSSMPGTGELSNGSPTLRINLITSWVSLLPLPA